MAETRVFVFDLDGVLYRGEDGVDHAADAIARLRNHERKPMLFFLTNNSSQSRTTYAEKLTHLGMPCDPDEIVTSASATADYLRKDAGGQAKRALVVGGPGIIEELRRIEFDVSHSPEPGDDGEHFDYVVVGMDRAFNYHSLWRAQQAVLNGARLIATNRDGQYPIEDGKVLPGGGAMVAALQACTDVVPTVIGKPEPIGLQTILDRAGVEPGEAVMIGDRLDTDVLCGNRLNVPTVLVLTGVTTRAQAEELMHAHPEMQPGRIITDLRDL
ncbi:MAG: HAD-IIA family hydrolase [Armatimonadaceae bacterium]